MSLLLLVALAGAEPQGVLVAPGQLRVMVMADTASAAGEGGAELSPSLPGGRYLYLPGAAVPEAGVESLMAPLAPESARAAAGLVAGREAMAGQLERTTAPMEVTVGEGPAQKCRHATIERVSLTLLAGDLVLRGQRALPDRGEPTPGPCPPAAR